MVQISGENSPPLSKDEGLTDIGHSMSIGNLILGVNSVTVSYLIHYDSLLQNATDIITKCDSYCITKCDKMCQVFYYKMRQLLQIATILLQSATFIINCDSRIGNALFGSFKNSYVYCRVGCNVVYLNVLPRIIS